MATTQAERDQKRRKKLDRLKLSKICIIFPEKYRKDLKHYAARKRKQWEKERNAL